MNLLGVVSAASVVGLDSIIIKPKRVLGTIAAQVTLEEVHDDELEITEHPVEQGAAITDHAYKRPARLRLHLRWSNSPSVSGFFEGLAQGAEATITTPQALLSGNTQNQVRDLYDKLLKLQVDRVPFDVVTGKRKYSEMMIKGITVTTNKELEHTLDAVVNVQQVLIVSTQTFATSVPAESQANAEATLRTQNLGSKPLLPTTKLTHSWGGDVTGGVE